MKNRIDQKELLETTKKVCDLANVSSSFSEILKLVEDGINISDAIAKFGIHRATFYRNITESQKQEIYAAKKLHTKYGVGSIWSY